MMRSLIPYLSNPPINLFIDESAMEADFQGFITVFLVGLVSTIVVHRTILILKNGTKPRRPPSPPALPIVGHLHLLAPIPHQALHKLSTRHGPLIHIFLGSVPCVVASSPDMAKECLKTHDASFSNRPRNTAIDYLAYGTTDFTFAPYGPYWKFIKKLCMSELLGARALDQLLHVRREELASFIASMRNKATAAETVDVGAELLTLTNSIISRMVMGHSCSATETEAEEAREVVKATAEMKGKLNFSDLIWFCRNLDLQGFGERLKKVRDRSDAIIERTIEKHQQAKMMKKKSDGVKDLLDILFDTYQDESSEFKLSRTNIKAFIQNIFAAGTDTSAITIEWGLAELMNHPQAMKKARQEIDSIIGKTRLVEETDISNLPYLQAIVKETLRLHPTSPLIVRESTESCIVAGYEIPPKTRLIVNAWAIGRDPNHWENPWEFEPERFVGGKEGGGKSQVDVRGQHFHLLPFGSGRRGCPGTSLALQVVQTTLAAMIQCFEWEVDGNVDMEEAPGLTLPRAHPLLCVPVTRLTPFPSFS